MRSLLLKTLGMVELVNRMVTVLEYYPNPSTDTDTNGNYHGNIYHEGSWYGARQPMTASPSEHHPFDRYEVIKGGTTCLGRIILAVWPDSHQGSIHVSSKENMNI